MTELNVKKITRLLSVSTRDKSNDDHEEMQFYYHLDHLGGSSYIINLDGEVMQHTKYVPFGEAFIGELELTWKSATAGKANCNNTWNTPYRFNDCTNEGRGKLACIMPSAANCRVELNAKEFDEETDLYYYGVRYMDPQNPMWLGVDSLTEKYPNLTGYCYTDNNPVKYIDPTGIDWHRNDETVAIFWQEGNANSITYDGQEYRNIGETYGIYRSGMRYGYQQDKITKVSDVSGRFNVEGEQYIPKSFITDDGTKVSVTSKYKNLTGGYGDYALSKDAASLLTKGINDTDISGAGIISIDVSTTTTGKHSPPSNHYVSNGGRAIDIDMVNGISVKDPKSHKKVDAFQRAVRENPILRENFGPNTQEKEGKTKRIPGYNNHIRTVIQKR